MSRASKSSVGVLPLASVGSSQAATGPLACKGICSGAEGLQQFVIVQKHDPHGPGVGSSNAADDYWSGSVGEFSPRLNFLVTRRS